MSGSESNHASRKRKSEPSRQSCAKRSRDTDGDYRCRICKLAGFASEPDVLEHVKAFHELKCDLCGLGGFYRSNNLKNHILEVHEGVGKVRYNQRGMGVSEFSDENYDIFKTASKETSSGLQENSYNIIFKKMFHSDNATLMERMSYINTMLGGVVDIFKADMSEVDTIQFILYGGESAYSRAAFSTPFVAKNDFTRNYIKNRVAAFLNSNERFTLNREINLDVKIVRGQGGRGIAAKRYHTMHKMLTSKKCTIRLKNNDNLCFPKALTLSYYKYKLDQKIIKPRFWKRLTNAATSKNNSTFLQTRAEMMQASAGLPANTQTKISDVYKFEKCFILKKFLIKVHHFKNGVLETVFEGRHKRAPALNILYHLNHYYPILSMKALKACEYMCQYCGFTSQNELYHHVCKDKCFYCHSRKHDVLAADCLIECEKCSGEFFNQICYREHLKNRFSRHTKSVCDIFKKCVLCGLVHNTRKLCESKSYCDFCELPVGYQHDCYINGSTKEENYRNYLIYDIESRLEKLTHIKNNVHTVHIPNLICSRLLCNECQESELSIECSKCDIRFFQEDSCVRDFLLYAGSLKNVCCLAHNSAKYDHVLLLRELWNLFPHKVVNVIPCGNSVMSISIGNSVIFRDTNLFFKSRLASLPQFFGFQLSASDAEVEYYRKGYYPYTFNCKANYNYKGLLPAIHYYATEKMTLSEKSDFLDWYKANCHRPYDFWAELKGYCLSDVNLLAKAVNMYRKNNVKYNVEPFNCITIAHLTYTLFTRTFLELNKISRLPMLKHNTSIKCENWLQYYAEFHNVSITPEYRIAQTPYTVDGYIKETNTCLEFCGCWYHGHNLHYRAEDIVVGGMTAEHMFKSTLKRIRKIKSLGYKVIVIWECEYDSLVKENVEFFKYRPPTLNIRSALYGGRCEVFSVYNDLEKDQRKGRSVDFVSLYPSVMCTEYYPVGMPVLLNRRDIELPFNLENYFGVVSCQVEPPAKLHIPVLPYKNKAGKLAFPLCRECCNKKIIGCTHYGQKCRNISGAWTTVELKLALAEGYKIIEVYQIYNFKEKSNTLFKEFILEMLRGKMENSGFPKDVKSKREQDEYIETIKKNTGVILNRDNINFNPGARLYHKTILNSLWGKFGQNPANKALTERVTSSKKLMEINSKIMNKKIEVTNMYSMNHEDGSDTVLVDYKKKSHHIEVPSCSNPILASFVTAYGRIKLYKALKIIGTSLIYCDTDSAYYSEIDNEISSQLNIGENLGQLKNELSPGNRIVLMICLAPKTYGYLLLKPEKEGGNLQVLKNKGFCTEETEHVNIKAFIELYRDGSKYITVENLNFFLKNRKEGTIFMKKLSKSFNYKYDKRMVVTDSQTLPWGYVGKN